MYYVDAWTLLFLCDGPVNSTIYEVWIPELCWMTPKTVDKRSTLLSTTQKGANYSSLCLLFNTISEDSVGNGHVLSLSVVEVIKLYGGCAV